MRTSATDFWYQSQFVLDSTGYGLYIVKGIVEAHGGRVWFESEGSGKGTTFFIEVSVA